MRVITRRASKYCDVPRGWRANLATSIQGDCRAMHRLEYSIIEQDSVRTASSITSLDRLAGT